MFVFFCVSPTGFGTWYLTEHLLNCFVLFCFRGTRAFLPTVSILDKRFSPIF